MTTEPKGSEREVVRHIYEPNTTEPEATAICDIHCLVCGLKKWNPVHADAAQRINAEPER